MFSTRMTRAGLNTTSRSKLRSRILTACSLTACAVLAFYLATGSVKSKNEKRLLTASPSEANYAVDQPLAASIQKGTAHALTLATGDFDGDGVSDLVTGYQTGNGTLALRRGNKEARSPSSPASISAVADGNFAQPFLTGSENFTLPEAPDYLAAGDMNRDGKLDLVAAANGSANVYLLLGDGQGGFSVPQVTAMPGAISSLLVDDVGSPDGLADLVVGVSGPQGPSLLLYQNSSSPLSESPSAYPLPGEATSLASGRLNGDGNVDLVVAAGTEVVVIHGPNEIEHIPFRFQVIGVAVGQFIWDRGGRTEIAALSDTGTIQFATQGEVDRRAYTRAEADAIRTKKIQLRRHGESYDLLTAYMQTFVNEGSEHSWIPAETFKSGINQDPNRAPVFVSTRVTNSAESDDLVLADPSNQQLRVIHTAEGVRRIDPVEGKDRPSSVVQQAPLKTATGYESEDGGGAPMAVLPMRLNLDTKTDLVVLRDGNPEPLVRILGVNPAIVVDTTADNSALTACTAAGNDCSLRGAIKKANVAADDDLITFAAGTNSPALLRLTSGTFDDEFNLAGANENTGDLDVLDNINNANFDGNLTIQGNGIDVTIIEGGASTATGIDRVIDINNFIGFGVAINMNFVGVTIRNGNAPHVLVDPGPPVQQFFNTDGGGIKFDGFDSAPATAASGPTGTLTVSGCKITANKAAGQGGGVMSVAGTAIFNNNAAVTTEISSNVSDFSTGGGINYAGGNTAVGQSLQITNATITNNSTTSATSGNGGGVASQGGSSVTISGATISNNTAGTTTTGQSDGGGGLHFANSPTIAISGGSITGNHANANGGGLWASARNPNNTVSTITINNISITNNTADFDNNNTGNGGAIYALFGNMTIGNSVAVTIAGNAANNGGGIYSTWNQLAADAAAGVAMTNGSLSSNTAKLNGGGFALDIAGTPTPTSTVSFSGVIIQSNTADNDNNNTGSGGGIYGNGGSQVSTTINSTTAVGGATAGQQNTANVGGGIHMQSGNLTSTGNQIVNNRAKTNGGGVSVAAGTTTLDGVTIRSNVADNDNNGTGDGGGIFRSGGTLNLNNTITIGGSVTGDGNTAVNGGGISNTSGALSMTNGSIRFNKAKNNGGGVQFSGSTLTLSGTPVLNNQATSDASGGGDGGGIHNSGTTVNITNNAGIGQAGNGNTAVNGGGIANTAGTLTYTGTGAAGGTIIGNSATGNGGGIVVSGGTANLSVLAITGNTAASGGGGHVSSGALNISLSRLVGNSGGGSGVAQTGGTALVENNWWGCDGFPNTGGCQTSTGTVDADPRIDLLFTPAAGPIALGGTKVFTADVSRNTNGTVISPVVMNGQTVNFATSAPAGGSVAPPSATIASFTATTTYTAPASLCGVATVTAQINNAPGQSANVTITCNADLAVTKTDSPDPVIVGSDITYTISFTNNGPSNDPNVTVTDPTPTNTTFVSAAVNSGTGWSISSPAVGGTGNIVFSKGDVANTETASFQVVVKVNTGVANNTSISNTVTTTGDPTDPTPGNNSDTEDTTGVTQADIAMTKVDTPDPVTAGQNITYTIGLTNNGPNPAVNASISDPIPANTTFVSVTTPAGWTRTDSVPVGGTGTITFSKPSVANGETASWTLVLSVSASTANGATISNTVTGASSTTDPTPANDSATAMTAVNTSADLGVTKTDAPDPVNAGSNITYTINFTNNGPSDAQMVTVTDATPANTTFVSASVTTGTGWTISTPAVGNTGNVVFSKGPVAAGETATFSMVVNVDANTPNATVISNDAVAASTTADPNAVNNTGNAMTTVIGPPQLFARDAKKSEPASGSAFMLFTVVLTPAAAGPVTVHYATADDTLGANPATANVDYTPTSGDLTFNAGQRVKVVSVPILADADSPEPAETLLLNLSAPTGAIPSDGQAVGTILQPPGTGAPGTLVISEVRTSGPAGADDDFVELYNNTDSPLTVTASDASGGYGVFMKGADCNANPILIATISNGAMIPARGHYLLVGSAYSLAPYATGDQTLVANIDNDANVAVFTTADVGNLSSVAALDGVGFGSNTGGVCDLFSEGTLLPALSGSVLEHSFARDPCGKGAVPTTFGVCTSANPVDTNNNSTDFLFVDTMGTVTPAGQRLGAPGPENLGGTIIRNSTILALLLDATKPAGLVPNRFRDLTPVSNGANGTLSLRRRFVNNTGGNVNRLRFRIVDITSAPVPPGIADVRALTSTNVSVTGITDPATCLASTGSATTPCTVTVLGSTLEQPPTQGLGGSLNSTLAAGTVTLGTPLANGASINLQFQLGVQVSGLFKFYVNIEALP